ncbi:arylsulfatase [Candidatus Sumerlaeota bacterium]|nr:arylsulfatase [Candidatus Sumerlaeota bacterium]
MAAGGAVGLTVARFGYAAPRRSTSKKPNIVLIMADDMGFSDPGCYGSEIATPALDRLAQGGARFTQFYNCARCCPTRAALLTGLYPHQAGVGHMEGDRGLPGYRGFLNDRCVTIAEVLRSAGYHTGMAGKWHVGEERPHWPLDRGFERFHGLVSGATNYFKIDPERIWARDNTRITDMGEDFYITDEISRSAVEQIEELSKAESPFFIYVAYTSPHWPLHALPADIAKYKGKYSIGWDELRLLRHKRQIELGIVDKKWQLTPRDLDAPPWEKAENKEWLEMRMAVYAAQIDRMDQGIARIVAKLKEVGADENTLVMFLADNGACAEHLAGNDPKIMPGPKETFQSYGLPWANASNTPFRRYKHWVHEGGISSPFIAHWPAVIKPGAITTQVGHLIDVMATCADVAGAEYPKTFNGREITPLEGKSLLPILRGGTRSGHDALFWEHEGNKAVRQGKWKLVSKFPEGWELYDMEADRTEMNNLAEKMPDKVKEMASLYNQWAKRSNVVPWGQISKPGKKPGAKAKKAEKK